MKKIFLARLVDILPDSVLYDPKLRASAEALSDQLEKVTALTREVLHLPRLDELDGEILDYLAEQFHIDFYEPLYLTETEKRNLIRESIAWHRIKGTPAAVEKLAHETFRDAKILEWFEYEGGQPYHFKISSKGYKQTPDGFGTFIRMINVAKNTRSWIDNFEVDYSDLIEAARGYIGDAQARWGVKEISLARPPNNYRIDLTAGMSEYTFGGKTISLHQPNFGSAGAFGTVYAGQLIEKGGMIVIAASPKDFPPYVYMLESPFVELLISDVGLVRDGRIAIPVKNYWQRQESLIFGGTGNFFCGWKVLSLPQPRDKVGKGSIGQGYSFVGTMKISPTLTKRRAAYALANLGQILTRIGYMKLDSATTSSVDPHKGYVGFTYSTPSFVGTADGLHGVKTLSLHQPTLTGLPTNVRVGQVMSRLGTISIAAALSDFPADYYGIESPLAEILLADSGFVRDGRKFWPVNTYTREYEIANFAAQANLTVGTKIWSLAPPRDEETEIFFGQLNQVAGDVKIAPDTKIKREYPINISVGQSNWRQGKISVDSETKTTIDGNVEIIHEYTTNLSVAEANFRHGDILFNTSKTQRHQRDPELTRMKVGQVNVRAGAIKVKTADKSSVPEGQGYADYFYLTNKHLAGIGQGNIGVVQIRPATNQSYRDPQLTTVRVGQVNLRAGEIRINAAPPDFHYTRFPAAGDWLKLCFESANNSYRTLYVADPREDLSEADIRKFSDTVTSRGLLLTDNGEAASDLIFAAKLHNGKVTIL